MDNRPRKRKINQEYWNEKKPLLYDMVITHALEWPSFTIEWLPDRDQPAGKDYSVQKMILGTYTKQNEPNYLKIAQVKVPLENTAEIDADNKVQIVQQINHDGEVNMARYMPQNPFIIATTRVGAEVYVFDRSKHPSKPPLDGACNPDLRLRGHNEEGFGLSWSNFKEGHLLSTSYGAQICLWDINATPMNKTLQATRIFRFKEVGVEDVAWMNENVFGSVSDDKYLRIWDLRSPSQIIPSQSVVAHQSEAYCLAFNPFKEKVVATGSRDNTVKLFDLRYFNTAFRTFDCHKDSVHQVHWNPEREDILASASRDRRLMVWDLKRIGRYQTEEEVQDGPPELLFIHGGHMRRMFDFSWNPCEKGVVASVAADRILQIWQMGEHIYNREDDESKKSTKRAA